MNLVEAANKWMNEDESFDPFVKQYFATALWSSDDESDEQGGEPMDNNYDMSSFADEAYDSMEKDALDFKNKYKELYTKGGWDDEQAGHDFWLTRNGHGAGFWDRTESDGYDPEVGKQLSDASEKYGEVNIYVGDDGKLYI